MQFIFEYNNKSAIEIYEQANYKNKEKQSTENPVSIEMRTETQKKNMFVSYVFILRKIGLEVNGRSFYKCVLETNFYIHVQQNSAPNVFLLKCIRFCPFFEIQFFFPSK